MKLGLCTSIDNVPALENSGVDFLEENVQTFLVPEQGEGVFEERLTLARESPIPVETANCFLPGDLKCTGPQVDRHRLAAYASTAFRRAAAAGIEVIVFGSGGARQIPEDFPRERAMEQFAEALRLIAPMAGDHGVVVAVEPLNGGECNFINSLAEGAAAVAACDHPNVRLLADIFHMLRDDEPPSAILGFGALLHHAHVAERARRTPPGTDGDDLRPYLSALREVGYDNRLAMECRWENLGAQAALGVRTLRRQLEPAVARKA